MLDQGLTLGRLELPRQLPCNVDDGPSDPSTERADGGSRRTEHQVHGATSNCCVVQAQLVRDEAAIEDQFGGWARALTKLVLGAHNVHAARVGVDEKARQG